MATITSFKAALLKGAKDLIQKHGKGDDVAILYNILMPYEKYVKAAKEIQEENFPNLNFVCRKAVVEDKREQCFIVIISRSKTFREFKLILG